MEESKTTSTRRRPADGIGVKPSRSAHVIDLRKGAGTATASTAMPAPPKPAPKAAPKPKKAESKPKPAPEPARSVAEKESLYVTSASAQGYDALPLGDADDDSMMADLAAKPSFSDLPPKRRFWPAFWRFLLLLIILGLILTGGVYLYLNYHVS